MRVTSITPMKNEGPYILEWVAHNRSIGINDMLVFSNDCSDFSDLILERLDEMGILRHTTNPSVRMNNPRHHIELVRYVNELARLRRSDWVTHLDADEFIRIKVGNGKIEDLVAAVPEADAISLSLHTFGCGGNDGILTENSLVTESFHLRADTNNRRAPVKYLARGEFSWVNFANNSPEIAPKDVDRVRWVNGDGEYIPAEKFSEPFKALPARMTAFGLVDVAHYTIRSFQGYLLQRDRGNANPMKGVQPTELDLENALHYWEKFNHNDVVDEMSTQANPDLRDAVDDLLKDPELFDLHEASLDWHRTRAQELLQVPAYAELYDKIKASHFASTPPVPFYDEPVALSA
ncbi:glycosyltransferase family 2 protein [Octadecabacter sp. G9-8]|uniref:Glycosyltransferase family 2 protein n=1 Tax=Octadecabacter dasysiphoniae TaxID=2909341 RepID=A0ABS9CRI9_9RHOB|nr:glycosyltransferase family 2 protein [Octadecabacter dasysiphoniae]MCF2869702.1 glycosyltransferase family 2 protein [Octadecabacter dasysiphoniae]